MIPERYDYVILSGGGSIIEPGTVSPEAEASLVKWLDNLDTHWACMTCSAGTDKPVTNRQAEIAAANHASQGGHPTAYARIKP